MTNGQRAHRFAIGENLRFIEHSSGLTVGQVATEHCDGEFFVQGAHVTRYHPTCEPHPILFLSHESLFEFGKPIRGGIPICFPWFSAHPSDPSLPAHGWARISAWELVSSQRVEDDIQIEFQFIQEPFELGYTVRFGKMFRAGFSVTNTSATLQSFELALHTYFQISDIASVRIEGDLHSCPFLDQLTASEFQPEYKAITFEKETDRIYEGKASEIRLIDSGWKRTIHINSEGSESTIVWNPWIDKSKRMKDFGDDEYLKMCCIETGNVRRRAVAIAPGETHTTSLKIRSAAHA
jgi:D-hexose-6-phosphate mutarotase